LYTIASSLIVQIVLYVIEPIFQILNLLLLFDHHRNQRWNLDELVVLKTTRISMGASIFEEPIKDDLVSMPECPPILLPPRLHRPK
jgi:hypothetical protein